MRALLLLALLASTLSAQTDFSGDNATAILRTLTIDIGPRPMGSPAEHRAIQFAVTKFNEHGCDTAYIMPFDRTGSVNTQSGIAIGIKRGATKRIILIGGHIDSSGPEIPGADDNGSGSAVVIELSRVLTRRQMQSTLVFACFGGEEQGLEGSEYFVDHFPEIDSVAFMLNIDMANGLGTLDVDGDTYGRSAPSWLVCAAFEEAGNLGYRNLRYPTHVFVLNYSGLLSAGTDHEPFLKTGVPAIGFTTDVGKPIHTPRDNFENFDPRGLKRSGDIVAKLVERFDGGTPDRQPVNYWLYTIGPVRLFVPYWAVASFLALTLLCAAAAFVMVRRRRIFPLDVKWSGVKMLLFTVIVVGFAWFSSNVVGMIKGHRYPWMSDLTLFYFLAAVFGLGGVWISSAIVRALPVSRCPYVLYKRAAIFLTVWTVLFLVKDIELAIYPASALLLSSLAIMVRNRFLKVAFVLLSPIWMVRLFFNEWIELIFHSAVSNPGASSGLRLILPLLLFVSISYPLFLALCAVYRDVGTLSPVFAVFRSRWSGMGLLALALGMIAYLYPRSVYSDLWHRTVYVEQKWKDPGPGGRLDPDWKDTVFLRSSEYLDGIKIIRPSGDSVIEGRSTTAKIVGDRTDMQNATRDYGCQSTWLTKEHIETKGDTTTFDLSYLHSCTYRPYTQTITYSSPGKDLIDFESPALFATEGRSKILRWYSFPGSIEVSVRFSVVGSDSVVERMEMVFSGITYPWQFEAERTDFIQRYRMSTSRVYRAAGNLAATR